MIATETSAPKTTFAEHGAGLPLTRPLPPLTAAEQELHQQQQQTMRGLQRLIDNHDSNLYGLGEYLIEVRSGGLWLRDPFYAQPDFVDYACQVTGKSRTTVERYIHVAEGYSKKTYLDLRRIGTSFTVLAAIQRGPELVRAQIVGIAAQRKLTMENLVLAQATAAKMLAVTGPPTGSDLRAGIETALDKENAPQGGQNRRGPGRGKGKNKGGSVSPGRHADPSAPFDGNDPNDPRSPFSQFQAARAQLAQDQARAREEALLHKQKVQADTLELKRRKEEMDQAIERGKTELAEREQRFREAEEREAPDLAVRRQQIAEQQQKLEYKLIQVDTERLQQQAALQAEREAVLRDRAAVDADRATLGTDRAALDAARTAHEAAIQQERATHEAAIQQERTTHEASIQQERATHEASIQQERAAHEATIQQERAELEAARAALEADRAQHHSAQQQAAVELQDQQGALQATIKRLEQKEEELDSGLFQLDLQKKDLAQQQIDLDEQEQRVHDDLSLLMQYAKQECDLKWPDQTWDVRSTLLCIVAHFDRLRHLAGVLDKHLAGKKGTSESPVAILDALIEFNPRFKNVPAIVQQAVKAVYEEYVALYRPQMEAHVLDIERREALEKSKNPPQSAYQDIRDPRLARPADRFAVRSAALLGNMGMDSPVQVVIGTDDKAQLVTLDLNVPQAIVIGGQQNAGKSSLIQGALEGIYGDSTNISCGTGDIAGIYFHFNNEPGAEPVPLARWLAPNDEKKGIDNLRMKHRAMPKGMKPVRIIVYAAALTEDELDRARREYPLADEVRPIVFDFGELGVTGVRMFMAAAKNSSFYMRKVDMVLAKLKPFSLFSFQMELEKVEFTEYQRKLVMDRLEALELFVKDGKSMGRDLRPGDLVIADIRSQRIDPGLAMTVFVSMMRAYSLARVQVLDADGNPKLGADDKPLLRNFKKLFIFDEGHRYLGADHGCAVEIANFIREMRAKESTVMIATQDPKSVPAPMIRLATVMVLFRIKALESLQYVARNFAGWDAPKMKAFILELATMEQGEARALVSDCANILWRTVPQKLLVRGTLSKPGGTTRQSIETVEAEDGAGADA